MEAFARMMAGLSSEGTEHKTIVIDPPILRRTARLNAWRQKGGADDQSRRLIGRTQGAFNTKSHAVTDAKGRRLKFFVVPGRVSENTSIAILPGNLAAAEWMLADHGYDAD